MKKIITEGANSYEIDNATGRIISLETGAIVTREWAYPVRQAVAGADWAETIYFPTREARDAYLAEHDHCDRLPRVKVMSDRIAK